MTGAADQDGSFYPAGSVVGLISGELMTPVTSAVLQLRIGSVSGTSAPVLGAKQLAVLSAVAARLIPQPDRTSPLELAEALHVRLSKGIGDGWRYADLPPDAEMVARGLTALDGLALAGSGQSFTTLEGVKQDDLLREMQFRRAGGPDWAGVSPARWLVEILAALVDIYYAHPVAQEEIGYAGMADARGWQDVGLNTRAAHEPEPLTPATHLG